MPSKVLIRYGAGRAARYTAMFVTAALAAGLLQVPPAQAEPETARYRPVDHEKVVDGHIIKAGKRQRDRAVTHPAGAATVNWPKPAVVEAEVPAGTPPAPQRRDQAVPARRAGRTPIWVAPPAGIPSRSAAQRNVQPAAKVRVRVLGRDKSRSLGTEGLLFTVGRMDASSPQGAAPQPGRLGIRLDYSGFAQAFGGSYGSRLRLVQLPSCALSTPQRAECRQGTPVKTVNDTEAQTLTADVTAAPAAARTAAASASPSSATQDQGSLFTAVASESSDKGDYKATALQPSAAWKVSPQTGDFSWSYEMRTPTVPGGLEPSLSLGYSSSGIDGRTSNANTQPSWVGDGFDLWPGYIERRYKSCRDDGAAKDEYDRYPGDQCWGYDNATLMFNGKGGELVSAGGNTWRLKNDDGTRVEQLKSSATDNGDNDGEHWKVTTAEGTQYFFGLNKLPHWSDGKPQTNSTWTTPVYGNNKDEPCHKDSGFADSWCQQAWRWNLDYVVDTHGNAMSYHYSKETNHYGRNLKEADDTPYTRAGWLDHINYGLRSDNLFPDKAPARVDFEVSERCIRDTASDCDPTNIKDHPDYWWDVPWDLNCNPGTTCKEGKGTLSPTFWSRKRLTKVTTSIIKPDGSGYRPVDSWKLNHAWGMADIDRQLLLESIVHTGEATTGDAKPVNMPPVSFVYKQLPNRVDKLGDNLGPFIKNRVATVYNETGGVLDVNYTAEDCTTSNTPSITDNHRRCFPTYWDNGTNGDKPALDWFHKYAVEQTVQTDLTGKAPDMVTDYDYGIGQPAWHFDDDDGLTPEKYKTWAQWHGFSKVRVTTRNPNGTPTQADHWYMQGMHGDRAGKDGGTKTVAIADGEGGTYQDHESLQGFEVRTVSYTKPGGPVASKTIQSPWHKQTASRTRSWGTVTANFVGFNTARTLTALDGDRWRETKVLNKEFDDRTGQPVQVENLGDADPNTTNDDRCTTTTLLHNTTLGILGVPAQVQTVAAKCGEDVDYTKQLVSDVRNYFDKGTFKAAPTRGDITQVDKVAATGTTPSTVKYVPSAKTTFDAYGRPLTATTVDNTTSTPVEATTTTTYVDTQGLTTKSTVTSPPAKRSDATTALTTTTEYEPAWGQPTKETDAGGKSTVTAYDPLGRVHKIWSPNRTLNQTPDREYQYILVPNQIVAIQTKKLNSKAEQDDSYELFDGWLRPRQTQELAPGGGRLISDTFYNPLGMVDRTYEAYYADDAPTTTLFGIDKTGAVETQTVYDYDGLGRTTAEKLLVGNSDAQERWRTSYSYGGDRVTVTPPRGGTPTTTVTDALGRTTELRQHRAAGPGAYATTTYNYNRVGQLAQVKAHGGHTWTYGYDIRGRKITQDDPDKGTSEYAYDDLDRLALTENANGDKIAVIYDNLGRKIEQRAGSATGTKLADWTYDTVRKGQLTGSARYDGTATYTTKINFYDNLNRPTSTTTKLNGLPAAEAPSPRPTATPSPPPTTPTALSDTPAHPLRAAWAAKRSPTPTTTSARSPKPPATCPTT
ncbi:hypothetical protein ACFQHO_19170 [Actinomadura yumaensis]|uniref:hypothetical protein n=1 Tax=Actinomadura yumaensis TaxID=111807 RepID=UPI003614D90A